MAKCIFNNYNNYNNFYYILIYIVIIILIYRLFALQKKNLFDENEMFDNNNINS